MTNATEAANETRENGKSKLPTHVAKVRNGYGKKATYERIGVAWVNDEHPPEFVEKGGNVIVFTKNPHQGRYGLFPHSG